MKQFFVHLLLCVFVCVPQFLQAQSQTVIDHLNMGVPTQLEFLTEQSRHVFKTKGSDGLLRYMRTQATGGVDLRPLRQHVFSTNGGRPLDVSVQVHPDMKSAVDFANEQLEKSGVDFFKFVPELDSSLPAPDKPFQKDERSYNRWQKTRKWVIPFIGFAACLIDAGNRILTKGGDPSLANMSPYLAQAILILGLEYQFARFSSTWNYYFWSDTRPGFATIPDLTAHRLLSKVSGIAKIINQGIEGVNRFIPRGVQANHLWSLMVNYTYTSLVYAAGMIVASKTGNTDFSYGFLTVLRDSMLPTAIFYYGFGMTQILIGQFVSRGEISEYQRLRLESLASYWGNLGRVLSLNPDLKDVGKYMMLAWGAFVTTPLIARTLGAGKYAEKTRRIFESNNRLVVPEAPNKCDELLSTTFERINFPAYNY